MAIQSVIFDKNMWSSKSSSVWLMQHNLHPIKRMHETNNYYRYRLMEPDNTKKYTTYNIGNGIKLIILR